MSKSEKTKSAMRRNWAIALSTLAAAILVSAPVWADAGAALPAGPKEGLALWAGDDIDALKGILSRALSAEEWVAEFSGVTEDDALLALADYLALSLPVAAPTDGDVPAVLASLPLDGKELFVQNCLSCHGGDRYFLQQSKTSDEWMGIFDAPYHRRLLTEGSEREIFTSYAAWTTPIALGEVPEELRDEAK